MANLLVVDDNIDVAELISEILVHEGHCVKVSYNGREAVNRIESGEKFDIIITDLIMPDLDGLGILEYLKEKEDKTPVLILSGGGTTISADTALSSVKNSATAILSKPIKFKELIDQVNLILD
ncbi:MAG: hypothetical protein COA45_05535 [Zetaproteobacteria bacterium]|nr:MAG: hypothetical protein COA45_05535 [Zetaproteobacteria bacterium]